MKIIIINHDHDEWRKVEMRVAFYACEFPYVNDFLNGVEDWQPRLSRKRQRDD